MFFKNKNIKKENEKFKNDIEKFKNDIESFKIYLDKQINMYDKNILEGNVDFNKGCLQALIRVRENFIYLGK